jgi:CarD family transcriptional regulator, regulator of rRNA transcription
LSTGEKKMLVSAKQMIVSEIALSLNEEGVSVEEFLDKIINENVM